jgi:hypothetical protein
MSVLKYVSEKTKKINNGINDYIDPDAPIFLRILIYLDIAFSAILNGVSISEYFWFQFFRLRQSARKTFIVHNRHFQKIQKACNKKEDCRYFDDKVLFNTVFKDFARRDWLDMTTATIEEFSAFVEKHPQFIVKPRDMYYGIGVRLELCDSPDKAGDLWERLKTEKALVEERIRQNSEMAEFNPTSVNTLRVYTILGKDDNPQILAVCLRMGRGSQLVDNTFSGGIFSIVDKETGVVFTQAVDLQIRKYAFHPFSKKQIVGFQVPCWDKIIDTVKAATKIVPTVRHVGWDVAINNENEIVLIEGNPRGDAAAAQMAEQVGKWALYKSAIKNLGN